MTNLIVPHRHYIKRSLTIICVLLTASIVLTGCSATPVSAPSPPSLDAPAALPVSAHVNLAPLNQITPAPGASHIVDVHIVPGLDRTGGSANEFTVFEHRGP